MFNDGSTDVLIGPIHEMWDFSHVGAAKSSHLTQQCFSDGKFG